MKLFPLVLAGSLAANAVLLGLMAVNSSADPDAAAKQLRATVAAAKARPPATAATPPPATWTELQADTLAGQRDQLRAAGFPPEIVRAILGAELSESFAERRKAIEQAQGEVPFWKNPLRDPRQQAALRDLYREQEKALKDLLGRDGRSDDPTYTAYLRRQFGDLPEGKAEQLRQIFDDYNQRRSDLYAAASGGMALLPEERQKIADLDKAMHADFASILTPQELEDYDLRSSNTAQMLRFNLTAFDATEQEYRAIFRLQQAFDDQYRLMGPASPEEMQARMNAQKQLTTDIKAALGPERGAEYERATDYSYRQATQLVARLELPPENAVALWDTQKEIQKRRGEIYSAVSNVPPAERMQAINAQLTALQQEAVAKITPLLGGDPSRIEVYKANGGQWLQLLVPRPPVTRPPIRE
jgi:hypothetical protein